MTPERFAECEAFGADWEGDAGYPEGEAAKKVFELCEVIRAAAPKWTTDRPTASGFYWFVNEWYKTPIVVHLHAPLSTQPDCLYVGFPSTEDGRELYEIGPEARWCGPLDPPIMEAAPCS